MNEYNDLKYSSVNDMGKSHKHNDKRKANDKRNGGVVRKNTKGVLVTTCQWIWRQANGCVYFVKID